MTPGGEVPLPSGEAHHALRVLRIKAGETVGLFDGRGTEAWGAFTPVDRRAALVRVEGVRRHEAPSVRVLLAPAWPHRDKAVEEIIRRGTELGVAGFHFWRAERSQRPTGGLDRWERCVVDSCKQCGRPAFPDVNAWDSLSALLDGVPGRVVAADLEETPSEVVVLGPAGPDLLLVVGPEGDFTEGERALLTEKGAARVSLGAQVLRLEVAAVTLATLALNGAGLLGTQFMAKRDA
ncbi:MAG: 16S rRNA (uracil(1498)-N(3))-methyltransferase [Candidatus Hydrogenedentes bacterium]|nr:16S rRNA (uracil(1498)-N(3))-methyltransferase [Candidatus Hydrogenedentota bacterium]